MTAEAPLLKPSPDKVESVLFDDPVERLIDRAKARSALRQVTDREIMLGRAANERRMRLQAGERALQKMSGWQKLGGVLTGFGTSTLQTVTDAGVGLLNLGLMGLKVNPALHPAIREFSDLRIPSPDIEKMAVKDDYQQMVLEAMRADRGSLGTIMGVSDTLGHLTGFLGGPEGAIATRVGGMISTGTKMIPLLQVKMALDSSSKVTRAYGRFMSENLSTGVGFGTAAFATSPGSLAERGKEGLINTGLGMAFPLAQAIGSRVSRGATALGRKAFDTRWGMAMDILSGGAGSRAVRRFAAATGGVAEGAMIADLSALGMNLVDAEGVKPLVWALLTGDRKEIEKSWTNWIQTGLAFGLLKGVRPSALAAFERGKAEPRTPENELNRQGWVEKDGEWTNPETGFKFRLGKSEGKPTIVASAELAEAMGRKGQRKTVLRSEEMAEKALYEIAEWTKMQTIKGRTMFRPDSETRTGIYLGEGREWRYIADKVYSREAGNPKAKWEPADEIPARLRREERTKPDPIVDDVIARLRGMPREEMESIDARQLDAVLGFLEKARPESDSVSRETLGILPLVAEELGRGNFKEAVATLSSAAAGNYNADVLAASLKQRRQEHEETQDVAERGPTAEQPRAEGDIPQGPVVAGRPAEPDTGTPGGPRQGKQGRERRPDTSGRSHGKAERPVERPSRALDLREFKAKVRARYEKQAAERGEEAPEIRFRLHKGGMRMTVLARSAGGKLRSLETIDVDQGPEGGFAGEWLTEIPLLSLKAASIPVVGGVQMANEVIVKPWSKPIINSVAELGSKVARVIGRRAQKSIDESEQKLGSINARLKKALIQTSNNPLPRRNWGVALQGRKGTRWLKLHEVEETEGGRRWSRTRGHLVAEGLYEGKVPAEAKQVMDLIQEIGVFETGRWMQEAGAKIQMPDGEWKPFTAEKGRTRWLRRMTPEVYDSVKEDPVFEALSEVLADINGIELDKVKLHLSDQIQRGFIRRDAAEHARVFEHFPDRVEATFAGGMKRWVRVLENDPHSALLSWTRHAAMRSSYIKEFGQDIGEGESTVGFIRTLKLEHGEVGQVTGERLFRTLNGMPLRHRYMPWGSAQGQLVRWFQLWDGIWRAAKLVRAFVPNLPETFGAPATFFGYSNVMKAYAASIKAFSTGKLGELFDQMQEKGIVTPDVVDLNIRSGRGIEDTKRIVSQVLYTPTRLVTEFNELITAMSALKLTDKLAKGKGNAMDKLALEGMGFSADEVSLFMEGKATEKMNRAVARRGVAFTMGGTSVAAARKSFLSNHRAFRFWTFAQDYFQQRTNQAVTILKAMTKKDATSSERMAAAAMASKYFFSATLSGAASWAILHYWKGDMEQAVRELKEEKMDAARSMAASSFMGGLMGTAFEAAFGNEPFLEVLRQGVTPYQSFLTLADFSRGQGRWKGKGLTEDPLEAVYTLATTLPAIGRDMERGLFGMTSIALGNRDPVLDQARSAYYRWRRKYKPIPKREGYEKQSDLRVAFRKVKDGLTSGHRDPQVLEGLVSLLKMKEAKSVGQSIRNWRIFAGADWTALTEEEKLRVFRFIGKEGVRRLLMQDMLLTEIAKTSLLTTLQETVIAREMAKRVRK